MPAASLPLPPLSRQAERLIELGVHQLAGMSAAELRAAVDGADSDNADSRGHQHPPATAHRSEAAATARAGRKYA